MRTTDLGKLRSLASCADSDGFFTVLAVDHPVSFILGRKDPAVADTALHGYPPGWYSDWHNIQEGSLR